MQKINLESRTYDVGFRVLTLDLKSLGLRKNPNILTYPIGKWFFLSESEVIPGKGDYGGIWVARTLGGAKRLIQYMEERYNRETRLFRAAIDRILYANSYRVKTNGIFLFEEITNN